MPHNKPSFVFSVLATVGIGLATISAHAQPGQTYASLKDLPDFAGAWTPLTPPFVLAPAKPETDGAPAASPADAVCGARPEFKREVVARCREVMRDNAAAGRRDPCARQVQFTGRPPAGAGGAFEILFTPGRVTMAIEAGLVRRIYLRDKPPPGSLDESRSGTSIGRWEGGTLVVETSGLESDAPMLPGSVLGAGAHVVERISLVDADTLRIESTLTAPAVLAAPLSTHQDYRRARDRAFTDFDTCVEGDRSFDQSTGHDRFDKTPPPDLPPPPTQ